MYEFFEFFPKHRTLRNGKTYSQKLYLKMFLNAGNIADAPTARDSKNVGEPINGVWPDVIEERIKANLEPLNEQISTLTQLLNQLIQENSACNSPTGGPRTHRTQSEHSPSGEVGTSRTLPGSVSGEREFFPTAKLFH